MWEVKHTGFGFGATPEIENFFPVNAMDWILTTESATVYNINNINKQKLTHNVTEKQYDIDGI